MKLLNNKQSGFTLIEIMIVIAIIGVIAAIAWPNYQRYVIKTKRTAMMTDLQNIGSQIQAQKLAKGSYGAVDLTGLIGDYPKQDNTKLYTVAASATPITENWKIIANPLSGTQMTNDGILSLDANGIKCRATICGKANEWNP